MAFDPTTFLWPELSNMRTVFDIRAVWLHIVRGDVPAVPAAIVVNALSESLGSTTWD